MTLAPPRPDWDLDDPDHAKPETDDDYEYVEPDAVPTRVHPNEHPHEIPVAPV
jgi:hypothetical protein